MCTWDVGRGRGGGGRRVRRFENILAAGPQSDQIHHGDSVGVLDGVFSPDGNSIAVADVVSGEIVGGVVGGPRAVLFYFFAGGELYGKLSLSSRLGSCVHGKSEIGVRCCLVARLFLVLFRGGVLVARSCGGAGGVTTPPDKTPPVFDRIFVLGVAIYSSRFWGHTHHRSPIPRPPPPLHGLSLSTKLPVFGANR